MDKNLHDLTHSVAESLGDIVYNTGWKDGWESAKTVCNIWANTTDKECEEMFGFSNIFNIFNNFSASEIEEKFKTWEAEHKNTYSKCNTCTHKNEDVICYDCVNDSEYENDSEQPKQKCKTCDYYEPLTKEWFKCNAKGDCKDHEQWTHKIELGDEVVNEAGSKGIVVGIGNGTLYLLMHDYDMPQKVSKEGYTKTGKHFPQVQELKNQLC